jgi:hypothetical protein
VVGCGGMGCTPRPPAPGLIVRLRLAVVVLLCLCDRHATRVSMSDCDAGERSKTFHSPWAKWGRLRRPGFHPGKPKSDFHPSKPRSGLPGTPRLPGRLVEDPGLAEDPGLGSGQTATVGFLLISPDTNRGPRQSVATLAALSAFI